jgi:hypothetical protein
MDALKFRVHCFSALGGGARCGREWNKKIGMINCFAALRAEIALRTQFLDSRRRCMCVVLQITLAVIYFINSFVCWTGGKITKKLEVIDCNNSANVYKNHNIRKEGTSRREKS